jgi:hypothetical protein
VRSSASNKGPQHQTAANKKDLKSLEILWILNTTHSNSSNKIRPSVFIINKSPKFHNMRFSAIHLTAVISLTQASPAPVAVPIAAPVPALMCARSVAETDLIAETIIYGVESAKCKILKCASVIATVACITGALPDIDSTLACVSGKADKVRRPRCDGFEFTRRCNSKHCS